MLVERFDAALDQFAGIQVVVGRPFEQLSPSLLDHDIVVGGEPDVLRLTDVADPRVLLRGALADLRGVLLGGRVVRNDQLAEILVALAEQGIDRLGEIPLAVKDRESNSEPGLLKSLREGSNGTANAGNLKPH